jgi:pimeloyl-ACP methyl ester carboxylesterase
MADRVDAQSIQDLKVQSVPLVLQATGSFFVGGHAVSQTSQEIGLFGGGSIMVDQMYVQFMIPLKHPMPPVVLIHGGTLSGKSFETTPDGRMGWYEYFARKGYPSYVVDQVGRARSGFNQAPYNDVRTGKLLPTQQSNMRRVASDTALVRFRITDSEGRTFSDSQFPVSAAAEFAKQAVPDLSEGLPHDDPNFSAIAELAQELKGAILIGHSQAGRYPFEAALLRPDSVRALVAVEPAGCNAAVYSDAQIKTLAKSPILILFGDHLDAPQSAGIRWPDAFRDCGSFVARITAAKGNATMLHTPELGIKGNSHMMMEDKNNLAIADLIMRWIDRNAK